MAMLHNAFAETLASRTRSRNWEEFDSDFDRQPSSSSWAFSWCEHVSSCSLLLIAFPAACALLRPILSLNASKLVATFTYGANKQTIFEIGQDKNRVLVILVPNAIDLASSPDWSSIVLDHFRPNKYVQPMNECEH